MKLFVSYRRSDSRDVVVPLCARLEQAFGNDAVFRDEDAIGPGAGFIGSIGGSIYTADGVLVVMGPQWLTTTDSRGRRRIDDKEDYVRTEIGLALAARRPTVPVLVKGASMPSPRELPRDIRNFASLSAFTIDSGPGFDRSVDQLISLLGGPAPGGGRAPLGERHPRRNIAWTSYEGRWQMPDGSMNEILQSGSQLTLRGQAPGGISISGEGEVLGRQAVLDCRNSLGASGRLEVELTQDGAYLVGTWSDFRGRWPIQMMRRT